MGIKCSKEDLSSISNWEKCRILGRGSFGVVYLGVPNKPGLRYVAIKTSPSRTATPLLRETIILQEFIGNPHIVQYIAHEYTFNHKHKCYYYNMILEYAPGGTFLDFIQKHGKIKHQTHLKHYLIMILNALSSIHHKGLVHADLKPDNILVFPSGRDGEIKLKISDFGLSKWCMEKQEKTKPGRLKFIGSARYMSPESLHGEVNSALDIWSLGCVFLNMITGERMWNDCSTKEQVLSKLVYGSTIIPNVPENLSDEGKDFLEKCFERNHERRWTADMLLKHPYLVQQQQQVVLNKKSIFETTLPIVIIQIIFGIR